jgi:Fe-S cluster biogenesis protein NfuA
VKHQASIEQQIVAALQDVRPYLQTDKGDVEFVRFEPDTGVAVIRFQGACTDCSMSGMTLRAGIERAVRLAVAEVKRVEAEK